MDSWDAQKMLDKYVYDYMVKKGWHTTAEIFAAEANVINPTNVAIKSPEGLLREWWYVFYNVFSSRQAEHAQESHAEASRTMDNVVSQVPYTVPASSPHSARSVHNISPVIPAFHPSTPVDELMTDLRFLGMDHPSQIVPFITDSSCPMEQIPNMSQQWEDRVHNISPVMPAFHLSTPVDEVMDDLRSLEMDPPSQRVPFVEASWLRS